MEHHSLEGPAKRLCAFVGEDETYQDKPLYEALMAQARTQGCAGASVMRGIAGYGASSRDVAKHALRMSTDRPLMVSVIDEGPRIAALAEVWSTMIPSGLVTIEDVCVVLYCARGECHPDQ